MNLRKAWAYLWSLPTTAVGLCLGAPALVSRGKMQWVDGVLEIHGGFVTYFLTEWTLLEGGASAMTLGHVVLGRDRESLAWSRSHERVHVRQCERWGPLFLPAYGIASLIVKLRGGDAYRDNPFEREAYATTNSTNNTSTIAGPLGRNGHSA
jgi:hypothetical protein